METRAVLPAPQQTFGRHREEQNSEIQRWWPRKRGRACCLGLPPLNAHACSCPYCDTKHTDILSSMFPWATAINTVHSCAPTTTIGPPTTGMGPELPSYASPLGDYGHRRAHEMQLTWHFWRILRADVHRQEAASVEEGGNDRSADSGGTE